MSDETDIASEREEIERNAAIENARRTIPIHLLPVLDCVDCSDITQRHAKEHCRDYAACVTDWEREQKALARNKNVLV